MFTFTKAAVTVLIHVILATFMAGETGAQSQNLISGRQAGFAADDWPMHRYNERRGAATPHRLADELHLNWVLELPEPQRAWPVQADDFDKLEFDLSYDPVVAGDLIFVPSMVTDKLEAYHIETGEKTWEFFTNGPIRIAPAVSNGRIYLPSDDGYLYCLDAGTGDKIWKFRGGPADRLVLGNKRLVSMWSIRGGPVVRDGIVYFAAGIWPHEGVFIHALNTETGEQIWVNSGTGSRMDLHQHGGAYAFGGVAPQGAFVISGDDLIVPGGRTPPAVFNRHTGELRYFIHDTGSVGKGAGGYRVYAADDYYFNPAVFKNRAYRLRDGAPLTELDAHVVAGNTVFGIDDEHRIFQQELQPDTVGTPVLSEPQSVLQRLHLLAGNRLYGSGKDGVIAAIESDSAVITWSSRVDGDVFRMIAARDRLFVVTKQGKIYSFGPEPGGINRAERALVSDEARFESWDRDDGWTEQTAELIETTGHIDGYALMFGIGSGRLLEELLLQSDLHITAFDPDINRVQRMQERFDAAGLYGTRVAVHHGDAMSHRLPDYIASLIVSEDPVAAGFSTGGDHEAFAEALFRPLRPYGGSVYLPLEKRSWYRLFAPDRRRQFAQAVEKAGLENAEVRTERDHVLLNRPGALPGAGVWSHQYSDAANTTYSSDDRVFSPLGITWFGGTSNEKTLPRHLNGPIPQVVEGRLVILGVNHISARCVYTGREIWSVELPLVGENFTSLEHEAQTAPVYFPNHPGANFIGSPYVTTKEGVYVIHRDRALMLDLDTGRKLAEFDLPDYRTFPDNTAAGVMDDIQHSYAAQIADADKKRWGHMLAYGNYLVVAAYPHLFDDRQPGRADNWNATSSEFLLVMNRFSGEIRWIQQARYGFRHNAIAVDDGRIFVMDNLSSEILTMLERRGIEPDIQPEIRALDIETGDLLWRYDEDVFGTWLSYDREFDILLQAGRRGGRGVPDDEPRDRMLVLRGSDGQKLWDRNERHTGPVALHSAQRRIIAGQNERSLDFITGDIFQIGNPINDAPEPWRFNRTYGCGTQNVSKHLITFRSGAAGYTDLSGGSGTGNLAGFRAGCTNNMTVADGVLNAPDYTRSCSCSYQHMTSLAFVHMPDVEKWTYSTYSDPEPGTIKRVGINLGAPGSRVHEGLMWVNHPRIERVPVPEVPVEVWCENGSDRLQWFTGHALEIEEENGGYRWVAASGVEGVGRLQLNGLYNGAAVGESASSEYTVRLHFAEPGALAVGERVFNVLLQGETVIQELDIMEATGGSRRVYVAIISGVTPDADGNMTLEFMKTTGSEYPPLLSGVDVHLE